MKLWKFLIWKVQILVCFCFFPHNFFYICFYSFFFFFFRWKDPSRECKAVRGYFCCSLKCFPRGLGGGGRALNNEVTMLKTVYITVIAMKIQPFQVFILHLKKKKMRQNLPIIFFFFLLLYRYTYFFMQTFKRA